MHSIYKNKHFHEDEKVEQETLTDCPNTNTKTLQLWIQMYPTKPLSLNINISWLINVYVKCKITTRDDRLTEYQRKEEENQCSNFVSHKYNPHAHSQQRFPTWGSLATC